MKNKKVQIYEFGTFSSHSVEFIKETLRERRWNLSTYYYKGFNRIHL